MELAHIRGTSQSKPSAPIVTPPQTAGVTSPGPNSRQYSDFCTSSKARKLSTGAVHVDLTHAVYWQRERISDRLKHALVERHGNNDARRSHLCILYLVSHYTDRRLCIEDIGASASYADVC